MPHPSRPLPAALLLSLAFAAATARAQVGDVTRIHDPAILQQADTVYLFSTGPTLALHTSTDLYTWHAAPPPFPALPDWVRATLPTTRGLWAPDISYFHHAYHLYYAASTFGSQRSAIGLATSPTLNPASPDYHWTDHGAPVLESHPGDPYNAIDPNVAFDTDNTPYLVFGSHWSGLYARCLDPATGLFSPADPGPHHLATRPNHAIEASTLIRHNNRFYLFASVDLCCRGAASTYHVIVGRADHLLGPYADHAGNPLLDGGATTVLASYSNVRGPGHQAVLQSAHADYLIHHFYNADNRGRPQLQIRPITWDENDWPLIGEPLTHPAASTTQPAPALPATYLYSTDFGPEAQLTLLPDQTLANHVGTYTLSPTHDLTLHFSKDFGNTTPTLHPTPDPTCYAAYTPDHHLLRLRLTTPPSPPPQN